MNCADCTASLDDVPSGDPCPHCGGTRRNATAFASVAVVAAAAPAPSLKIGYSLEPGWANQWRSIQQHLIRLREQYQDINVSGNLEVEETVHALFLSLNHLGNWLYNDDATSLDENAVNAFVAQHRDSLRICRAYANTRKHKIRDRPRALMAQITSMEIDPNGYSVKIGYRPWDQPTVPVTEVDALTLAERSEQDWRDLLSQHDLAIPG